jgi:hypothetical protein
MNSESTFLAATLSLRKGLSLLASFALIALAPVMVHADNAQPRAVGEVTMSVGPVVKTSAQGVPEVVQRGAAIMPGDRLDTAEGGHIHVRFIDGALVSVRPGSRLWIEDYRYDAKQVSESTVRFKLEYGVARAISGAAAEGARERFRLNTPLVAIGVRGTDFVVNSGPGGTTASVNQGAIVMSPFHEGCEVQGLGPCGTASAKLLSADMGRQLLAFNAQFAQPELRPLPANAFASAPAPEGGAAKPGVAVAVASSADPETLGATAMVEGTLRAVFDGKTVVAAEPPAPPPNLQWGRWAEGAPADATDFSVARSLAANGRLVTVGNADYSLYRTQDPNAELVSGLGAYSFSLDRGYAQYTLAGQVSAATVDQGLLSIDFAARRFSTDIKVSNAVTGTVGIAGAGFVRSDGIFFDRSVAQQVIAGATALDGKTAGYFFEKAVGAGALSGITLWSRP